MEVTIFGVLMRHDVLRLMASNSQRHSLSCQSYTHSKRKRLSCQWRVWMCVSVCVCWVGSLGHRGQINKQKKKYACVCLCVSVWVRSPTLLNLSVPVNRGKEECVRVCVHIYWTVTLCECVCVYVCVGCFFLSPSSSQSCLYLSVMVVPCCLHSASRGSAMNCSVISVNILAPLESRIFSISLTCRRRRRKKEVERGGVSGEQLPRNQTIHFLMYQRPTVPLSHSAQNTHIPTQTGTQ